MSGLSRSAGLLSHDEIHLLENNLPRKTEAQDCRLRVRNPVKYWRMGLFSSAHDYNHPDIERPLSSHSIRLSLFCYISPMTLPRATKVFGYRSIKN